MVIITHCFPKIVHPMFIQRIFSPATFNRNQTNQSRQGRTSPSGLVSRKEYSVYENGNVNGLEKLISMFTWQWYEDAWTWTDWKLTLQPPPPPHCTSHQQPCQLSVKGCTWRGCRGRELPPEIQKSDCNSIINHMLSPQWNKRNYFGWPIPPPLLPLAQKCLDLYSCGAVLLQNPTNSRHITETTF